MGMYQGVPTIARLGNRRDIAGGLAWWRSEQEQREARALSLSSQADTMAIRMGVEPGGSAGMRYPRLGADLLAATRDGASARRSRRSVSHCDTAIGWALRGGRLVRR